MSSRVKMSNKSFRAITISSIAVVAVVCIGATVTANVFSSSLDTYVGRGERVVNSNTDAAGWDAEFYDQKFADTNPVDGSVANGLTVAKRITDEGLVLLKNDGVLPLTADAPVTPFGFRYLYPVFGGSGSGTVDASNDFVVRAEEALGDRFDVNETVVDAMRDAAPQELTAEGISPSTPDEETRGFEGASTSILEYDPSIYSEVLDSAAGSTGVVFLGRLAGEGDNLKTTAYADGTAHNLQLSGYEKQTIMLAKQSTETVVAVVNAPTVMEIAPLLEGEYAVDAIIWMGFAGGTGFDSLGDILSGEVNPSGRTVDIWDADMLANPTAANFTPDRTYTNTADTQIASNYEGLYYAEYEEGLYYGYRYYETADALGELNYSSAISIPFGYGLSYTTFEQEITSISESGDTVSVTVAVSNTGEVDGKEVVQLYQGTDYTDFDTENNIERPVRSLVAFDKVEVAAGAIEEVTLDFAKEDLASYSNTRENPDGTVGAYVLPAGDYTITLGRDSHEAWGRETVQIAETEWFDTTNPRQSEIALQSALDDEGNPLGYPNRAAEDSSQSWIAASNQFDVSSTYMDEYTVPLTRADWAGTQPTSPEDKALSDDLLARASQFDPANDELLGDNEGSAIYETEAPVSNADNGLVLSDLRGADYYDPAWDELLNQVDYDSDELSTLLYMAAYTTGELSSIGKPTSQDHDGPAGFNLTGAEGGPLSTPYASAVVAASTWNTELLYDFGVSIGQEALTIGYSGWYGPGMNVHRNPFTGRNWEYYSEDPLLTGELAAGAVSGAADQGAVVYQKHFGLNQYDGPATAVAEWADEQSIREIYLKPWEIAIRDARMNIKYISDNEGTVSTKTMRAGTGLMASASLIDGEWAAANYNLLTNVVRGEWGYEGVISTDMFLQNSPNITAKVFRSGSDLKMWFAPSENPDISSSTAQHTIRRALHNIGYAYANSNLMQGAAPGVTASYTTSPWVWGVVALNVVGGLFILLMVFLIIRRTKLAQSHPERYRGARPTIQ